MTEITLSPEVTTRVVRVTAADVTPDLAVEVLHAPGLLAIDDWADEYSLADLRRFREKRVRPFDSPFCGDPPSGLAEALEPVHAAMDDLFARLYGAVYAARETRRAWRPAVSKGEPLHFDTWYTPGELLITAFLNVSEVPRKYGVSHTMPWLCEYRAAEVRACCPEPRDPTNVPLHLRKACLDGGGPLGPATPRHLVEFAPGTVWIFDPKRVSHELRYGEYAVSSSWGVAAPPQFLPEVDLSRL